MFENEEWRPVPEFPHYVVSNYGRVKNLDRPNKALKAPISDKGFPIVTLYGQDSKTRYLRQINSLVAQSFLAPPLFDDENSVWHIDGDFNNCRAENLKWEKRSRVLEWNEMHRTREPKFKTPSVRNNRTGIDYTNAFECGMAEGRLESDIVWRVERQARHVEDDEARYRYIYENKADIEDVYYRNEK